MEIMPTVAQRNQRQHSRTMKNDLCTVFSRELRREIRLDALPSLLELEDAFALLLEALASGRGARDLDPDLQLLLVVVTWIERLEGRGFMSLAQVTRVHAVEDAATASGEGCTAGLGAAWTEGICAFGTVSSKISKDGHGLGRAVICGLACLSGPGG